MSEPFTPYAGRLLKHRQFGGRFTIQEVTPSHVKILSDRPGARVLTMARVQLFEHYEPQEQP